MKKIPISDRSLKVSLIVVSYDLKSIVDDKDYDYTGIVDKDIIYFWHDRYGVNG